jgi:hypothetical protein
VLVTLFFNSFLRNLADPLCPSTITPKFKTIINENIYYTKVFHGLFIRKKSYTSLHSRAAFARLQTLSPATVSVLLFALGISAIK